MSQARFQKRQRELARLEKAKAKAARKAERLEAAAEAAAAASDAPKPQSDPGAIMAELETLHKRFDDEQIDFETFEEKKAELLSRLTID